MRVRKVHDEDGLRFELLDDEERPVPVVEVEEAGELLGARLAGVAAAGAALPFGEKAYGHGFARGSRVRSTLPYLSSGRPPVSLLTGFLSP